MKAVADGSPAAEAGIARGTQIIEFAGKPLTSVRDYLRAVKSRQPGDVVKLKIAKPGAEPTVVSVTLGEVP